MKRRNLFISIDALFIMTMTVAKQKKVLNLAAKKRILRPNELAKQGLPSDYLWRLYQQNKLEKVGHGMYALPDKSFTEYSTLVEASLRVPHGIICLLSALRFHDLTTQEPFEVWMAIDGKARAPKEEIIPLRIVRFSGKALTEGIKKHKVEGVEIKVYSPAKTIADCFKYRNKIGIDVAIEALREALRKKVCTVDELWRYAKICRVSNVMRPYMEALLA